MDEKMLAEEFAKRMRSLRSRGLITTMEWYHCIVEELFITQKIRRSILRKYMTVSEWTVLAAIAGMDGIQDMFFEPVGSISYWGMSAEAGVAHGEAVLNGWENSGEAWVVDTDGHACPAHKMGVSRRYIRLVMPTGDGRTYEAVVRGDKVVTRVYEWEG